jgi:polynucleotide 5'-kinase involved in rRNA processing
LRWPWRGREEVHWLRLEVGPACVPKSREQRQEWRRELFAAWLKDGQVHEFELDHLALQHAPPASVLNRLQAQGQLEGLLVGLDDHQGVGLCLGLLEELDVERAYARVWAPAAASQARGMRLGNLRLHRDGTPKGEGPAQWLNNM